MSDNSLRIAVLKAQGWGGVEIILNLTTRRWLSAVPDPTTDIGEAMGLLESTWMEWRIDTYGNGKSRVSNFNDVDELFPGWPRVLGGKSYIEEVGPFCEAACRAFLRATEIINERNDKRRADTGAE